MTAVPPPAPRRPIVRYHGGKWRLAPWVISHFPQHKIYVEPFGGAASVLLQKPRSYAEIYNDLDGEVVNLFRMARDRGPELTRVLRLTPFSRAEFNLAYEPSEDPLERARRMMIRCGMGFGSTGSNPDYKTGFRDATRNSRQAASTDWANLADNLEKVTTRLQGVTIENRDALEVMARHDSPETLHYVDPPYVHSTRSWTNNKDKYAHEMSDTDHSELAEMLNTLRGAVILSGYQCDLYDRLYSGWQTAFTTALADKAKRRTECLWLRNITLPLTLF